MGENEGWGGAGRTNVGNLGLTPGSSGTRLRRDGAVRRARVMLRCAGQARWLVSGAGGKDWS